MKNPSSAETMTDLKQETRADGGFVSAAGKSRAKIADWYRGNSTICCCEGAYFSVLLEQTLLMLSFMPLRSGSCWQVPEYILRMIVFVVQVQARRFPPELSALPQVCLRVCT